MNPSDPPKETGDEPSPEPVPSSQTESAPTENPSPDSEAAAAETEASQQTGEEGLPDVEPLTPELVEEEAIRGDFMLRWFVVVLAAILGCTEVRDTITLVRIRTGEHLASHGWLPPATDVFSYTATDQAWINLSWLADLLLAGLYHTGGDTALSIAGAILAAFSFWLLTRTSRPGVSTWWGSACAALGLVAAFPLLTIGPDGFTVLGLAALMLILARVENDPSSNVIWAAPVVLMVWSQFDAHAFLGLMLLLGYAVGHTIDASSESAMVPIARMWSCAAAAVVGMLLHPFHVHTLLDFVSLHTEVYPAHAAYNAGSFHSLWLPLTDSEFWDVLAVPPVAGLLIAGVALVAMLLNAGQLRWSHAVVWLVINGFAVAAGRQLHAAAAVNVALAALNGQDWYRATFRQEYSVETGELIFSRGGRAVTVLALLALALLAGSGRLMGPDVRRVGIGFDPEVTAQIESFQDVLADSLDDRPFNFRLEQGDLLIWIRQRPFIDSRLDLYARGDDNLVERFRRIRLALRSPSADDPDRGQPEVWQEAFEQFHVTHVLPRLSGDDPDYGTFVELLVNQRWRLARLGAATAAIYDYQSPEPGVVDYLEEHQGADFVSVAFRDVPADAVLLNQPVWPTQTSVYEELLKKRRRPVSNDIQVAMHYSTLLRGFRNVIPDDQLTALAYLVIRHAWAGLSEHPNAVDGYLALAEAHQYLLEFHPIVPGGEVSVRMALQKAVECRPEDKQIHLILARMLSLLDKRDLALEHMREYERLHGSLAPVEPDHPQFEDLLEQNQQQVLLLEEQVQAVREQLEVEVQAGTPRIQVAGMAYSEGLIREALRILEEDATVIAQDPQARLFQMQLLMEVGRAEEAWLQLENMETAIRQNQPTLLNEWISMTALANLNSGNFQRSVDLWDEQREYVTMEQLRTLVGLMAQPGMQPALDLAPLAYSPHFVQDLKPLLQSRHFADLSLAFPGRWGNCQVQKALALLQQGRPQEATEILSALLESDPESDFRPVVAFYLQMLTGEPHSFLPPSEEIPITGDMFAEDESAEEVQPGSSTDARSEVDSPQSFPPPPPVAAREGESDQ